LEELLPDSSAVEFESYSGSQFTFRLSSLAPVKALKTYGKLSISRPLAFVASRPLSRYQWRMKWENRRFPNFCTGSWRHMGKLTQAHIRAALSKQGRYHDGDGLILAVRGSAITWAA